MNGVLILSDERVMGPTPCSNCGVDVIFSMGDPDGTNNTYRHVGTYERMCGTVATPGQPRDGSVRWNYETKTWEHARAGVWTSIV